MWHTHTSIHLQFQSSGLGLNISEEDFLKDCWFEQKNIEVLNWISNKFSCRRQGCWWFHLKFKIIQKKLSYQYICLSVCPSVCQPMYVKLTILKSKAWDIYRLYTNFLRCIWLLDVKRESLWLSADVVNGVAATVVVVVAAVPIVINFWIWPYFV